MIVLNSFMIAYQTDLCWYSGFCDSCHRLSCVFGEHMAYCVCAFEMHDKTLHPTDRGRSRVPQRIFQSEDFVFLHYNM